MASDNTRLYTDHRNLLYVFHSSFIEPGTGRHVVYKDQRWVLYLSQFQVCIENIRGDLNVMSDIMTRWYKWGRGSRGTSESHIVRRILLQNDDFKSPMSEEFKWPSNANIISERHRFQEQAPRACEHQENLLYCKEKIWVSD